MIVKPTVGVNIALIEDKRVLLTLREDFEVWCLPGGAIDPNESAGQAALREMNEETGLEIELTNLIGIYSDLHWFGDGLHILLFSARYIRGQLHLDPKEVLAARYFNLDELPEHLLYGHRQRIEDALSGRSSLAWRQENPWPFASNVSREELYELRDRSGLSRRDFYLKNFKQMRQEILEVGQSLFEGK